MIKVNHIKWVLKLDEEIAGIIELVIFRLRQINSVIGMLPVGLIDFIFKQLFGILVRQIQDTQIGAEIFSTHDPVNVDMLSLNSVSTLMASSTAAAASPLG